MNYNYTRELQKLPLIKKKESLELYYGENKESIKAELDELETRAVKNLLNANLSLRELIYSYDNITDYEKKGLELLAYRIMTSDIVNGVNTILLSKKVDLDDINQKCKKYDYYLTSYKKFTGRKLAINEYNQTLNKDLSYTLMIFKSGKINCIGVKSLASDYLEELDKSIKNVLKKILPKNTSYSYTIDNLNNTVLSVKIPKLINLKYMNLFNEGVNWRYIKYNNQLFPGLVHRIKNSKVKVTFFSSGSAIFTGVSSFEVRQACTKEFFSSIHNYLSEKNRIFKVQC